MHVSKGVQGHDEELEDIAHLHCHDWHHKHACACSIPYFDWHMDSTKLKSFAQNLASPLKILCCCAEAKTTEGIRAKFGIEV